MKLKVIKILALSGAVTLAGLAGCGSTTNTNSTSQSTTASNATSTSTTASTTAAATTTTASKPTTTQATTTAHKEKTETNVEAGKAFNYKYDMSGLSVYDWNMVIMRTEDGGFIDGVPYYEAFNDIMNQYGLGSDKKVVYPGEGNVFVMIGLGVVNNKSEKDIIINTFGGIEFILIDDDSNEYKVKFASDDPEKIPSVEESTFVGIEVEPKEEKTIYLVYELPEKIKESKTKLKCKVHDTRENVLDGMPVVYINDL